MNETHKSNQRRKSQVLFQKIFTGKGIDIGCGTDNLTNDSYYPNVTSCEGFDKEDGDAQKIHECRPAESYDFVYSSNCLEHLENPKEALESWLSLVKPGGYLVFVVPDEDLYEQGYWPPKWNSEHKWTFTIHKNRTWCPKSIDVLDLVRDLPFKIIKIELVDTNYDYSQRGIDQTANGAEAFIEVILQKIKRG